ncbi:hypothetical protein AB0E63_04915 [Kribbella sp. NPDC026596]|uniref:hypothetical protein n=1 Tax=Kribbella sp. NPDC026596 TaxID=3155122 RepID=UPI0033E2D34E
MRFARTALGLLLTAAGLVVTVAGALAAFWLVGPDNTISTSSRELTSQGLAVVTAPDLLDRHGPTLHVTATGDKSLFVGVGQDLDVRDYLSGSAHTRLIHFDPPATFGTQEMRGRATQLTQPSGLDWWVAKSGTGQASVAWPIQDGRYDVVVMNADGSPAVGAQVRFGVEIHRAFGISLVGLGAGILILALGLSLTFRRHSAAVAPLTVPVSPRIHQPAATPLAVATTPLAATAPLAAATSLAAPTALPAAPEPTQVAASVGSSRVAASAGLSGAAAPVVPTRERVSPFAPQRVSPFAPVRPAPVSVPSAPMFMSAAAVAKAKSPVFLAAVGAGTSEQIGRAYDNRAYDDRSHDDREYDEQPVVPAVDAPVEEPETVSLAESPEFQKSDEAVRRTAALLASGAMLLTTTSCGLLPAKNSEAAVETRPAVTLADAQAVVQRYNELNNKANESRDAKVAETIEGNPTLAQTRAGYLIGRKLDTAGKDKDKPFSFTEPTIGAPEFASYPMRFVVDSGVSGAPDTRQLGVWQRQSAGTPWLLTNSVYPSTAMKLPSLEGLRTPTEADLDKLSSLPAAVSTSLAAYLTGGPKAPQAKLFAPSPGMTKLVELRAKTKGTDAAESYIASVEDTFAPSGEPLAFITSTGEALVFLSLTEQYLQRVEPGSNAYWTSGEATAFSSMVKYTQTLHQDYLHQVALVIPTKTATPIRILSMDGQLVGAGGS